MTRQPCGTPPAPSTPPAPLDRGLQSSYSIVLNPTPPHTHEPRVQTHPRPIGIYHPIGIQLESQGFRFACICQPRMRKPRNRLFDGSSRSGFDPAHHVDWHRAGWLCPLLTQPCNPPIVSSSTHHTHEQTQTHHPQGIQTLLHQPYGFHHHPLHIPESAHGGTPSNVPSPPIHYSPVCPPLAGEGRGDHSPRSPLEYPPQRVLRQFSMCPAHR